MATTEDDSIEAAAAVAAAEVFADAQQHTAAGCYDDDDGGGDAAAAAADEAEAPPPAAAHAFAFEFERVFSARRAADVPAAAPAEVRSLAATIEHGLSELGSAELEVGVNQ